MFEYDLTKTNRHLLNRMFRDTRRVDIGIDSVIEGHMGRAYVENPHDPRACKLQVGPFCYFAGDFSSAAAAEIMRQLEPYHLLMVCPDEALNIARETFGKRLVRFPRYSFSLNSLSAKHTGAILDNSPHKPHIERIDARMLDQVSKQTDHFLDISDYESAQDFLTRGLGFGIAVSNTLVGVAYSSLISSAGIEVSIYVESNYRRQGMATALGCALIGECLSKGIDPHWDAANPESCTLAEKLGYTAAGAYDAYYVRREPTGE